MIIQILQPLMDFTGLTLTTALLSAILIILILKD